MLMTEGVYVRVVWQLMESQFMIKTWLNGTETRGQLDAI